jgi:hypothetical protein
MPPTRVVRSACVSGEWSNGIRLGNAATPSAAGSGKPGSGTQASKSVDREREVCFSGKNQGSDRDVRGRGRANMTKKSARFLPPVLEAPPQIMSQSLHPHVNHVARNEISPGKRHSSAGTCASLSRCTRRRHCVLLSGKLRPCAHKQQCTPNPILTARQKVLRRPFPTAVGALKDDQ